VCTFPASFRFDCGQSNGDTRCADEHRIGVDPYDNFRDLTLPVEPVGLDISDDGTDIVTSHQISGAPAIGLTVNAWDGTRPAFEFALTGNVAPGPTEVAHIPKPAIVAASSLAYQQGFLVSYNLAPEVDIFRVDPDALSTPPRPFLTRAWQEPVNVNQTGTDSRGIAIDPSERQAQEAKCAANDLACLRAALDFPLRAFIANRSPPTLLIGRVVSTVEDSNGTPDPVAGTGIGDALYIDTATPLPQGVSKVVLGQVIQPDGTPHTVVFIVSFDTRRISMYDPDTQTIISPTIVTGRGPQPIAFDACTTDCQPGEAPHAYLYVGHFTDSYLGVVDLDERHPETFATMFASVGFPIPPLESK
jgi:hypothetical protein